LHNDVSSFDLTDRKKWHVCSETGCVVPSRQQELDKGHAKVDVDSGVGSRLRESVRAWRLYSQQEVFRAAVPLALLYLTVMSFVSIFRLCALALAALSLHCAWAQALAFCQPCSDNLRS
jgi:hypothetical protein